MIHLKLRQARPANAPTRNACIVCTSPSGCRSAEVWSADFVLDRTAEGRVLKCLAIVDDATTEAMAIVPARALSGLAVTRALDRLAVTRGLPRVLRTDNGLESCGRAMLTWAHERRVTLRLIEPGKRIRTPTLNRSTGGSG